MRLRLWPWRAQPDRAAGRSEDGPPPAIESDFESRVRAEVESFRPFIRADGGDIIFLGVSGGVVRVRLTGACVGCPASFMTLQMGIERSLRERFPEIREVRNQP